MINKIIKTVTTGMIKVKEKGLSRMEESDNVVYYISLKARMLS